MTSDIPVTAMRNYCDRAYGSAGGVIFSFEKQERTRI